MKQLQLLFLFLLSSFGLFCQTGGVVYYKYSIKKDLFNKEEVKKEDKKLNGYLSLFNKSIRENADKIEFKLKFNKTESLYAFIKGMEVDVKGRAGMGYKMAKILAGAGEIFYQNSKENIQLTQTNAYGEDLLILDSISNIQWNLVNEQKKIGRYTCYKATTIKVVKNTKGTFKTEIVAWYTPQLPFLFGPKGYGGLPGLIIELEEKNRILHATKIKLYNKKRIVIKRPTKGKLLHIAEYKMKEEELINQYKKRNRN